jgi:putative ABC transport system permease protein
LVKLHAGADVEAVRRELLVRLAGSPNAEGREIDVHTRAGIRGKEQQYWLTSTAVGQFFIAGVLIALLVGGVFVYQMMTADIARRLTEHATIRALGYTRGFLSRVVFWQGLFLALVGYVPGLAVSLVGYVVVEAESGAPIGMTLPRVVGVFALTVLMCLGSAGAAVRVAHQANPAELF